MKSLLILLGVALGWPSPAVKARQELRLIVPATSEVRALDARLARDIFRGRRTRWGQRPVQLVFSDAAPETFEQIARSLGRQSPDAFRRHWLQLAFQGEALAPVRVGDDRAMIEYVAAHPGTIGYTVTPDLPPTVRAVFTLSRQSAGGRVLSIDARLAGSVFNILRFVTWPADAPEGALCVWQAPGVLEELRRKRPPGWSLRRIASASEARTGCRAVFAGRDDTASVAALVAAVRDRAVLTIGSSDRFVRAGGMVGLVVHAGGVAPSVRLDAVGDGRVRFRSALLRIATLIR